MGHCGAGRRTGAQVGFTLIELVIVIALAAILVSIASPSLVRIIQINRVATEATLFVGDLKAARAEAIRQGSNVTLCPSTNGSSCTGGLAWQAREFTASDLDGSWYVLAATDSAEVNAAVAEASEARHTFCVRADRADAGSAWTPATGETSGVTVAVITSHDPLRARRIRDRLVEVVTDEGL